AIEVGHGYGRRTSTSRIVDCGFERYATCAAGKPHELHVGVAWCRDVTVCRQGNRHSNYRCKYNSNCEFVFHVPSHEEASCQARVSFIDRKSRMWLTYRPNNYDF